MMPWFWNIPILVLGITALTCYTSSLEILVSHKHCLYHIGLLHNNIIVQPFRTVVLDDHDASSSMLHVSVQGVLFDAIRLDKKDVDWQYIGMITILDDDQVLFSTSFNSTPQIEIIDISPYINVQLIGNTSLADIRISGEDSVTLSYPLIAGYIVPVYTDTRRYNMLMSSYIRVVDAVDNFIQHLSYFDTYISAPDLLEYICADKECDSNPPRKVVGVLYWPSGLGISTPYYIREGYRILDHVHHICACVRCTHTTLPYVHELVASILTGVDIDILKRSYNYVSLGYACYTASGGTHLGVRPTKSQGYKTGPFDLLYSNEDGLVKCILEDCVHLTDSRYLELIPLPYLIPEMAPNEFEVGTFLIYNNYYKFVFNHESPAYYVTLNQSWTGGVNHFVDNDFYYLKQRYNTRYQNFVDTVTGNKAVLFMVTCLNICNLTRLHNTIKYKYPRLVFDIGEFIIPHIDDWMGYARTLMNLSDSEMN